MHGEQLSFTKQDPYNLTYVLTSTGYAQNEGSEGAAWDLGR